MNSKELYSKTFGLMAENMASVMLMAQDEAHEADMKARDRTENLRWELEKAHERESFLEAENETLKARVNELESTNKKLQEEADKYEDWWFDGTSKVRELEAKIKDLESFREEKNAPAEDESARA
jgi:DNA repair exonuclease SbcCD ATPase subunit